MRTHASLGSTLLAPLLVASAALSTGFASSAAVAARVASETELRAEVRSAYASLGRAIGSEAMPSFMTAFSLDFVFESREGDSMDRGPWRREWLERFEAREHLDAGHALVRVVEADEAFVVVEVEAWIASRAPADRSWTLERALFEDTWGLEDDGWKLRFRQERESREPLSLLGDASVDRRGDVPVDAAGARSPWLQALAARLAADAKLDPSALRAERLGKGPVVEPVAGDPTRRWVTFLWVEPLADGEAVSLRIGDSPPVSLEALGEGPIRARSVALPADSRCAYSFSRRRELTLRGIDGRVRPVEVGDEVHDPLSASRAGERSWLEVTARVTATHGERPVEARRLELGEESLGIRVPVGLLRVGGGDGGEVRRIVLLGFESEDDRLPISALLAASAPDGELLVATVPALVRVGDAAGRVERVARLLAQEVVPSLRELGGDDEAAPVWLIGSGSIGRYGVLAAARRPELFRRVVAVGADWERAPDAAALCLAAGVEAPRLELVVGSFESAARILATLRLREALGSAGRVVDLRVPNLDGSDRARLDALRAWLRGAWPTTPRAP